MSGVANSTCFRRYREEAERRIHYSASWDRRRSSSVGRQEDGKDYGFFFSGLARPSIRRVFAVRRRVVLFEVIYSPTNSEDVLEFLPKSRWKVNFRVFFYRRGKIHR